MKLGRNYKLFIQKKFTFAELVANPELDNLGTFIEINYPLTINFVIDKNSNSSANMMNLQIYNLSEKTYSQIVQDRFNTQDLGSGIRYRQVILKAGYKNDLPVVFVGNLLEAYTQRQGVDMITTLVVQDGLYAALNSFSSFSVTKSTAFKDILNTLFDDLFNGKVEKGTITDIEGTTPRGSIYDGNTFSLIKDFFGKQVVVNLEGNDGLSNTLERDIFIDNERINILNKNDYIDIGKVLVINTDTGLLGTPMRRETYIEIEMIFEPTVILGQLVQLESATDQRFNGQYKIYGISHRGVFSGSVSDSATTTLQLYIGTSILKGLKAITQ